MDDLAIKVEHVSKKYCKSLKRSMIYGLTDISRNTLGLSSHPEQIRKEEFWALNDISFELKRGETLGIIGPNGSGKTTLLKLLNGIFWPDKGKITIRGRVGALIEVGAGFHPLLTGRENIYVNGAILGMNKQEINKKFDAIVDFADIGDFLDTPVKFYSSGMFVRLGFAIAVHCEPDILLVDEVLAVGDANFKLKCVEKLKQFQKMGKTIVYISHEMTTIKKICQCCIWLNKGRIEESGEPDKVVNHCLNDMIDRRGKLFKQTHKKSDILKVSDVWIEDKKGNKRTAFKLGENMILGVKYSIAQNIPNLVFGSAIISADNICICALNTRLDKFNLENKIGENKVSIEYKNIDLLGGVYFFNIGFFESKAISPFLYISRILKINVESPFLADGFIVMEHRWENK